MKLTKSDDFLDEYSAVVVRIGELVPVVGSDFLATTIVSGFPIVVRKDEVKEGDVMIYCPIETELDGLFLAVNNLYCNPNLNNDQTTRGYIDNNGRIRIICLRHQTSMGMLLEPKDFSLYGDVDFAEHIGESFDTVNGNLFIKVFCPEVSSEYQPTGNKLTKTRCSRIIPGTFKFHYDTAPLNKHYTELKPTDSVTFTEKMDGISFIVANIKVLKKNNLFYRLLSKFNSEWNKQWTIIYASRHVIKNKGFKKHDSKGYYSVDIYKEIADKLGPYLKQGMTVYGECVGYLPNGTPIQKHNGHIYNYGCKEGEFKIMPYRIYDENGEWEVEDVIEWSKLCPVTCPMTLFYHGTLNDYLDYHQDNWHEALLAKLKSDANMLMEQDEPTCGKGIPAEGVVMRIDHDPIQEAFKLKSERYLFGEAKDVDKITNKE